MSTTSRAKAGGRRTTSASTKRKPPKKPPPPSAEPDDPPRKWRVTFEVTRIKVFEPDEKIKTAKEAEEKAREQVLFDDEIPLDREEIEEITALWVDDMDVGHVETCQGDHCRHYGCSESDGVRWFCSQCDPEAYA